MTEAKKIVRRVREDTGRTIRRSAGKPVSAYEAASGHPMLPNVLDPSPSVTARQQRRLQVLSRHMYRNDAFVRGMVNAMCRIFVGNGPVPVSRFPERDELWMACSSQFDNTGNRSFGSWLRQDVYRNRRIDGEAFVRRWSRIGKPDASRLTVPVEWQAYTSEFVPHDFTMRNGWGDFVNGVSRVRDKVDRYAFHPEHPGERRDFTRQMLYLKPDEVYHVFDPLTGNNRGEVALACALLRAVQMSTLENAELRRKIVASLKTVFIERPESTSEDLDLPSDEEVDALIDAVAMAPGAVHQLPYGYKANFVDPSDEPGNFEKALRWQLMAICTSGGLPVFEITGEGEVERMGRLLSQRMQSSANIEHDELEHQLLNPMMGDFSDAAFSARMWRPPADAKPWQIDEVDWRWPNVPMARFDQELSSLTAAAASGHIPHSYVGRTLFGLEPQVIARISARDAARADAVGLQWPDAVWRPDTPIAVRYGEIAAAEEAAEIDLVEASLDEDSIMDDDVVQDQ